MKTEALSEAIRAMGGCTYHTRIFVLICDREKDWSHPLARAHSAAAHNFAHRARRLFDEAFLDGEDVPNAIFRTDNSITPADWRRQAERAARCFDIGRAFAEALEERAQVRRRSDAARREALEEGTRITVLEPHEPHLELVAG